MLDNPINKSQGIPVVGYMNGKNISEEIEILYLVGAGSHPGAGIPSVVTSSEVLAQLVADPVIGGS